MLKAISPIDGRYHDKTQELGAYYSEYALIKARVKVEIEYFQFLARQGVGRLSNANPELVESLGEVYEHFEESDAELIKGIEREINHDVKAVEYFVKEKVAQVGLGEYVEYVHLGLTSQDINNTAVPWLIKSEVNTLYIPRLQALIHKLQVLSDEWKGVPMLARTHGQPARPTTMGKEMGVFVERLKNQFEKVKAVHLLAKFGGATGNFNAHKVAFPDIDWPMLADRFIEESFKLRRSQRTTQIAHYDDLAELFHAMARMNTILLDLCKDLWAYISMDYLKQRLNEKEVGSSAMPHKVNPIDFENAEGNLGLANALFEFLAGKLPVSRMQRDLTDSTVLRNVGVPIAHTHIALKSIEKGLTKIELNRDMLHRDLEDNWAVVAEAIQTILRSEGYEKPYEALKSLTRGKGSISQKDIKAFIDKLKVSQEVKSKLHAINPQNYIGYY